MTKAVDIYSFLDSFAPVSTQLAYDNAGFLFGNREQHVGRAILSLDVTLDVIEEAVSRNCDIIISHHPLIFHPVKNLLSDDPVARRIIRLSKTDLCVISMHTNLDQAAGGVNDALIKVLGAVRTENPAEFPFVRVGYLEKSMPMSEYLPFCKKALNSSGLRYYDSGRPVSKIACIGGAGDDGLYDAYSLGCDTYITADIRYHAFLDAKELGINLIDGDHFCTENPVVFTLQEKLSRQFPDVEFIISGTHCQTASFI